VVIVRTGFVRVWPEVRMAGSCDPLHLLIAFLPTHAAKIFKIFRERAVA
jgi:hypothetical protein